MQYSLTNYDNYISGYPIKLITSTCNIICLPFLIESTCTIKGKNLLCKGSRTCADSFL